MTPNVRHHSQALVEAMEAVRSHCLATAPEFCGEVGSGGPGPFELPPGERAVSLLMAAADLPADTPAHRREARRLLHEVEAARTQGESPASVAGLERLGSRRAGGLDKGLRWATGAGFAQDLSRVPGPVGAVRLVRSNVPGLSFPRAARFLHLVGYDCAAPAPGLRRWLHRFGLLDATDSREPTLRCALQALNDLSIQGGMSLRELAHFLALFTGADGRADRRTAVCASRPRCGECPAAGWCPTGQAARRLGMDAASVAEEPRLVMKALPPEDRPREKLLRRGADQLTDAELLAILLRTGSRANGRRLHALELAQHLLASAGSLDRLAALSVKEMSREGFAGQVQAVTVKAALELARRLSAPGDLPGHDALTTSRAVFRRMRGWFLERKEEHFLSLLLDTKNRVIREVLISRGTLNQSLVHPREAFKEALRDSASGVIFVHNHPSGDPTPSRDDRAITRRLVQAGQLLGIRVLDHIVIGRDSYFSFADEGILEGD